jgi:hypothetical protein
MAKAILSLSNVNWSAVLKAVLAVVFALLICINLVAVNQSFRDLLSMTARIQTFKSAWMEVALKDRDNITVSLSQARVKYDDPVEQDRVIDAIARLTGLQMQRLFTIDPSQLHCQFTQPNAEMRLFVTLDYELGEMGLISSTPDPEGSAIEAQKTHPDIGMARGCHRLQLTARGQNVRTALIGIVRTGLEGGSLKVVK